MATLQNAIRYHVNNCSDNIHQIKQAAFKTEKATKGAYKHPDGRVKSCEDFKYPEDSKEGFRFAMVEYDKVVSSINPNHPDWKQFQDLKAEAAKWLTALAILKVHGVVPSKADLRKSIRKGLFKHHLRKHDVPASIFGSFAMLCAASKETDSREINEWVASKEAELAMGIRRGVGVV